MYVGDEKAHARTHPLNSFIKHSGPRTITKALAEPWPIELRAVVWLTLLSIKDQAREPPP